MFIKQVYEKLVYFILPLNFLFLQFFWVEANNECIQQYFGYSSFACKCNASYCDSIDPIGEISSGEYVLFTSTKAQKRLQRTENVLSDSPNFEDDLIVISINENQTYQEIIGWGGTVTDSSAINLESISPDLKNLILREYFSEQGLNFSMLRVTIGPTDLSTEPYSYDDVPGDFNLDHFNLSIFDYKYKIPVIHSMLELKNDLKIFGSAWTPPLWMKDISRYTGVTALKPGHEKVWSDYHIKFFDFYRDEGIHFWGVTTGNQPLTDVLPTLNICSLGWTPKAMSHWIVNHFGPAIRKFYPNMTIIAGDEQRPVLNWWLDIMFKVNDLNPYIDAIGVHPYLDVFITPLTLTRVHNKYPNKYLIVTEYSNRENENYPKIKLGSWEKAEDYLGVFIENLNHWVTGWVDWTLSLDVNGGPTWTGNHLDGLILVDLDHDYFYKQPLYYAMAHITKFVPEKSIRIYNNEETEVRMVVFKRPDNINVAILMNKDNNNKHISLSVGNEKYINLELEKRSFNTVLWRN